jgi:hypothetical protein
MVRPAAAAAAAAPPPPPAILITWMNLELRVFSVRYLILLLRPPLLFSKCSKRRCNWRFFQNANNSACIAEKWSQLF